MQQSFEHVLNELMDGRGISNNELARQIDVDPAQVGRWRLGAAAGVEHAIPHRYRHTYATVYLSKYPGDEVGLRRILGHISTETMRDYVHLSQTIIAQRAGRVSPTSVWLNEKDGSG